MDDFNYDEENHMPHSMTDSLRKTDQEVSDVEEIEREEEELIDTNETEGSSSESNGMDSSQELYFIQPTFSPARGDPDGDEFPSWSDENNYDAKKVYRSELKMMGNPPPPVPISELPPDEAPPPLPSSVPPIAPQKVLARRSSSVEDKKHIFIAQTSSNKVPSPMPRSSQEPSKKSVKDKILMFSSRSSSISTDDTTDLGFNTLPHGSTIRNMSNSTSSLPRSAAALSKSSDNLFKQGMNVSTVSSPHKPSTTSSAHTDKWKISQSTFDLSPRKNSTDSSSSTSSSKSTKNFGLHGLTSTQNSYSTSKIMHERSQSMLDVGQENGQQQQPPSYQRVSSTYRYNSLTPKADLLNSTTLIESRRKANLSKLRGLVIPDKTPLTTTSSSVIDLPTIISKDAVISPHSTMILNKMEQSKPRQVIRTESFDSYNNEKSAKIVGPIEPPDITDWKLSCTVPKYSPAFKRRSLTPYQSSLSSSATTQKTLPVTFNAGTTTTTTTTTTNNYKVNTPEPKSLESLTSPHSDSSFEFSANSPLNEPPRSKVFTNNMPPTVTARKTSLTKIGTGNNNETTKDAGAEIHNSQPNNDAKNRVNNDNNVHGTTTKYNGKGKLEDSDNDSAVSSSRSSISHGLSPPNSPTPEESSFSTPDPDNNKPNGHDMEGEEGDSSNSDEGWRVLKPQSVEAINRKNVLASAKFSSGGGRGDENSSGQSRRSDDDEADAEDTESSCSELDVSSDKKRRPSLTNRLGQIRRIPNSKVDTEEDEEEMISQPNPSSHSQQSSMDLGELILPELTESPLQAIFDMEVQMAYINEICDALPTRSGESGNSRYFCRRDSEATVIERPIIKERKHSQTEQIDNGGDRRARNRSSSGCDSDFSSSISVGSQHQSHHGVTKSDTKSSPQTIDKPEEKWSTLEKKYSKSLTAVNLLGTTTIANPTTTTTTAISKHIEHPSLPPTTTTTPSTITMSQYSSNSNDGFEKSIDRMMEKTTSSDAKGKAASTARIPRGRNDFKSLSEKWQQLSSDGTTGKQVVVGTTPPPVTKPPLFEKPQHVVTSYRSSTVTTKVEPQDYNDVISPSHHHQQQQQQQQQQQPAVVINNTSSSLSSKMVDNTNILSPDEAEGPSWTPERRAGERHLNSSTSGRNSENVVPMSSTKRSVSVNDIRRAFEKAEIAVNSYGRDDNCTKNGSKDVDGLSVPSAHFRVSSFDSTTSEDSSATTPAGIYGSVNSLVSSAPRDPYGSITSLASSTSLISPQELQQLIDEANQSLEEAGTPSHEVCVIILHREYAGGSLGITLAGGADYETKEITVHKVLTGSIADRDGRVHRGDRVLSINGKSTKGLTHREGLNLLKAPRTEVVLVVSRGRSGANGFQTIEETSVTLDRAVEPLLNGSLASLLENDEDNGIKWGPIKSVMLIKDGAGLGFSLDGGFGSIHGDKPLTVKKIFVGGPAEKCGELKVGDLIVSINNINMSSKSRTEVWNFMKKIGDGELKVMEVKINVRSPIS